MFLHSKACLRNWGKWNELEAMVTEYVCKAIFSLMIPTESISIPFLHTIRIPGIRDLFLCISPSTISFLPIQVLAAWTNNDQHGSRVSLQPGIQFTGCCVHRCYHIIQFRSSFRSCADAKSLEYSHFCCCLIRYLLGWSGSKPLTRSKKKKKESSILGVSLQNLTSSKWPLHLLQPL